MCNDSCLFNKESMPNVRMLLYANDVVIVNDTIMFEFCSKYCLSINLSKTNTMIFRNVGRLRMNENIVHK